MKKYIFIVLLSLSILPAYSSSHHPQAFLKAIKGSKNEGEQIYNHFCVNCHAKKPLISLGAPRIGEGEDWKPRLKQGLDTLFLHVNEGLNAMPPRGGCFECTDEQLMMSVMIMLPETVKKDLAPK